VRYTFSFRPVVYRFYMARFNFFGIGGLLIVIAVVVGGCSGKKEPATPAETFQTYVKAFKKQDAKTMKLLLSSETVKMHEQEAKTEGVSVDDIVKRDTLLGAGQTTVEYRNQKIDGDKATLEYKNQYGSWETMPFVRENGEWKIDKKSFADQIMQDMDRNSQQLDDEINRGHQPN